MEEVLCLRLRTRSCDETRGEPPGDAPDLPIGHSQSRARSGIIHTDLSDMKPTVEAPDELPQRRRPAVLLPFFAILGALAASAAVVLGPVIGSGLQNSVSGGATVAWAAVALFAVGAVWLVAIKWQNRSPASVGFHRRTVTLANVVIGLVLGAGAVACSTLIALAAGGLERTGASAAEPTLPAFLIALVAFALSAVYQDVILASGLMATLRTRWPLYASLLVPSMTFATVHLGPSGTTVLVFVNDLLFAVVVGLLFFGTNQDMPALGAPVAFHTAWNMTIAYAVGVALSGTASPWGLFGLKSVDTLWSGGRFGIEGGLGTTVVLVVITTVLVGRRLRHAVT